MIRKMRLGLLAFFMASLVVLTADLRATAADKEDLKKAMDILAELVKSDGKGAEAASKKTSIDVVMHLFKPANKGGIGVGEKGEGIEPKIIALSKKALPADQLKKEADILITLARQTKAIADINEFHGPAKKVANKDPKDWKKYNDEMRKFSVDLVKAIESGKADDVKKVSTSLNSSCVNCHTIFRD